VTLTLVHLILFLGVLVSLHPRQLLHPHPLHLQLPPPALPRLLSAAPPEVLPLPVWLLLAPAQQGVALHPVRLPPFD
jgi:hypothetical protein